MAIQGAGGNGGVVPFERFALECGRSVSSPPGAERHRSVRGTFTSSADGAWDFGDGDDRPPPAPTQTHTFTEPGVYRVRQTAPGAVTGSTVVTVTPARRPRSRSRTSSPATSSTRSGRCCAQRHTGIRMSGGHLRLQQYAGDMHGGTASAFNACSRTRRRAAPTRRPRGSTCRTSRATRRPGRPGPVALGDPDQLLQGRLQPAQRHHVVGRAVQHGGRRGDQGTTNTAITGVPTARLHPHQRVGRRAGRSPSARLDGTTWTAVGGAVQRRQPRAS